MMLVSQISPRKYEVDSHNRKIFIVAWITCIYPMVREVSLETLPNVNICNPSHDKNLPIMSVTGLINHKVYSYVILM